MRIAEILEQRRPVFSFEFFPPKTEEGQRTLEATLGQLQDDRPDFVSMTYGAGGTTRNATVELTKWIKQDLGIEAMAHLSCVGEPTERLVEILTRDRRPPASRTCSPCAATRRAARPSGRPHPGGPAATRSS